MKQTDEKGNSLTYWGGLEEPKQELPKLGTKEFNDLASVYFGGKPKQETLEEVAPMVELVVFLDKIKKNLTNKTEVLTIQLIIDTIKNEFVDKEIKWQQEQCKKDLDAHLDVAEDLWLQVVKQNKKMYSEEDLISLLEFNYKKETNQLGTLRKDYSQKIIKEWFEQFKKK